MKSILLTITTEQLQKSINDLQTKVNSLDTVKELQEKVISAQDQQLTFLNDSIANLWQPIAIVSGIVGFIFSAVFIYVAYLNRQAQIKVEEATKKMTEATDSLSEAEKKIEQLDNQLREADRIVKESSSTAATAQHKLTELQELADEIANNQWMDMTFSQCKWTLKGINSNMRQINRYSKLLNASEREMIPKFSSRLEALESKYDVQHYVFTVNITQLKKITDEQTKNIEILYRKLGELYSETLEIRMQAEEELERRNADTPQ